MYADLGHEYLPYAEIAGNETRETSTEASWINKYCKVKIMAPFLTKYLRRWKLMVVLIKYSISKVIISRNEMGLLNLETQKQ